MISHRFHGGPQHRHDPAHHGIFIHGGSNVLPKWYSCDHSEPRRNCNRFSLTLPTSTRCFRDDSPEMNLVRNQYDYRGIVEPTFQRILRRALKIRRDFPWLAECGIFTCTEFAYSPECHSSGIIEVQLVAHGEALDWDAIIAYPGLPVSETAFIRSLDAGVAAAA